MSYGLLKGKVAVVTGSVSGIGKAIALRFADEGAKVAINYSKSEAAATNTAKEINKSGAETVAVKADVAKAQDVNQLVEVTMERFGKIDILVNNAGIYLSKPLIETAEEEWDQVIDTNLKGVFLCSQRVVPIMMKQRKGRIINIASVDSLVGEHNSSAYCASKGGVMALTMEMALELGPKNITVNAIAPGTIDTPQNEFLMKNLTVRNRVVSRTPVRRIGMPSDVAEAALFFAKDGTEFITGTLLCVDGGWMAACGNAGLQEP